MTANQEPPGPRKSRRLAPEELARELANRFKSMGSPGGDRKWFLPHFDLLNAGRLILGFGALLIGAALIAGFVWLSGLSGYETTGKVTNSSPVYACPGEPELGELFEGETITLIGSSPDRVWLVVRDDRGPGNGVYVLASVVVPEGDVNLLSVRGCEPSDAQPAAVGASTATLPGESSSSTGDVTTTRPSDTTLAEGTPTASGSGLPGTSGTTPRPSTTTTTRPNSVTTTQPEATSTTTSTTTPTSTSTPTSSSTSTTSTSTSTTSTTTTTTTSTSTTTTMSTTTTTTVPTTTTLPEESTTTTLPP